MRQIQLKAWVLITSCAFATAVSFAQTRPQRRTQSPVPERSPLSPEQRACLTSMEKAKAACSGQTLEAVNARPTFRPNTQFEERAALTLDFVTKLNQHFKICENVRENCIQTCRAATGVQPNDEFSRTNLNICALESVDYDRTKFLAAVVDAERLFEVTNRHACQLALGASSSPSCRRMESPPSDTRTARSGLELGGFALERSAGIPPTDPWAPKSDGYAGGRLVWPTGQR